MPKHQNRSNREPGVIVRKATKRNKYRLKQDYDSNETWRTTEVDDHLNKETAWARKLCPPYACSEVYEHSLNAKSIKSATVTPIKANNDHL